MSNAEVPWVTVFYIWLIFTAAKILLFHSYKSTDFEVHRNWMAITYEQPLRQWYFEATSVWTLDYPPFFAYFEWVLARGAAWFDREMVRVGNLEYDALSVVMYQRATVVVSDLLFAYACVRYFQAEATAHKRFDLLRFVFNYASVALLILDGIHFQYNSMMYGLMILAIVFIKEKSYFSSALTYAILLNFKHIYLYFAPCFGLLYLKKTVFNNGSSPSKGILNFSLLALQTALVFAVSFGAFLNAGGFDQLQQIASRLFPFQRGLVHSYWAANVWAAMVFYNKYILNIVSGIAKGNPIHCIYDVDKEIDQETAKRMCLIATMVFLIPLILRMFKSLNRRNFNYYLAVTNFIVFNFGYHVHEKAILMTLIPLMLDTHKESPLSAKVRLVLLKTVAIWTLLPLLINPMETLTKHLIFSLDLFLTLNIFVRLDINKDLKKNLVQKALFYLLFAAIFLLQTWSVFFIDLTTKMHPGWVHRYQDMVPAVATVFNQILFIEMYQRAIMRPEQIEGSWEKRQGKAKKD